MTSPARDVAIGALFIYTPAGLYSRGLSKRTRLGVCSRARLSRTIYYQRNIMRDATPSIGRRENTPGQRYGNNNNNNSNNNIAVYVFRHYVKVSRRRKNLRLRRCDVILLNGSYTLLREITSPPNRRYVELSRVYGTHETVFIPAETFRPTLFFIYLFFFYSRIFRISV